MVYRNHGPGPGSNKAAYSVANKGAHGASNHRREMSAKGSRGHFAHGTKVHKENLGADPMVMRGGNRF